MRNRESGLTRYKRWADELHAEPHLLETDRCAWPLNAGGEVPGQLELHARMRGRAADSSRRAVAQNPDAHCRQRGKQWCSRLGAAWEIRGATQK
jgi:hypothetical protein